MEPASNEKLPVTFAALHVLGGTYRIPTDVLGNGGQVGKTWRGNLVLRGRGDPTLSYQDLSTWPDGARARHPPDHGLDRRRRELFDSKRGVWGWKSYFYGGESPPLSALTVDRCVYKGQLSSRPALAAAALFKQALKGAGVAVAGNRSRVSRRSRRSRSRTSLPRRSGRSSGTWTAGATISPPSSSSSSSARRRGTARPPAEPRWCGKF